MILFFSVFGFIFISCFAIVTEYIYEIFPVNKITNFFKPISKGVWGKVNSTVLPIIIWGFIELPIMASNTHFLMSVILNIFVSCAFLYVIKFSAMLFNKENKFIDIVSILITTILGQTLSYLVLYTGSNVLEFYYSVIGIVILFIMYIIVSLYPPKSAFFNGQ